MKVHINKILYSNKDGSDKVYISFDLIYEEGKRYFVAWGKRNGHLSLNNYRESEREKKIGEKIYNGYVDISSSDKHGVNIDVVMEKISAALGSPTIGEISIADKYLNQIPPLLPKKNAAKKENTKPQELVVTCVKWKNDGCFDVGLQYIMVNKKDNDFMTVLDNFGEEVVVPCLFFSNPVPAT